MNVARPSYTERRTKLIKSVLVATVSLFVLSGCGGAPGNAELREALRSKAISFVEQLENKKISEKDLKLIDTDLQQVKLVECRKADPENGFNCDWTGGEKFAMVTGGSHRLLKTDSGWILATTGR